MNSAKPVTIIMIEDDEGHARLIEKNIRRAGISNDIRHFTDGNSALDYLYNAPDGPVLNGPALILLDLNLPDMSGTDILIRIKADDSPLRRTPVTQASYAARACVSGSTLRMAQHDAGSRAKSSAP